MSSKGATKKRRIASNKGVEQQRPTGVSVECDNASDKKTTFQEVSGIVNLPLNIKRTICTLCRRKDAARLMAVCKFWSLAWAQCEFTVMHDVDDLDSVERDWYQQYERLESAGTLTWVRRVVWKVWTRYDHLTKSLVPQRRKAMAIFSSLIHVEELSVLQSGFEIEHWVTVMSAWPRLRSCELQCQDDTESAKLLAGIGAISPLLFDHLDVRAPRASESFSTLLNAWDNRLLSQLVSVRFRSLPDCVKTITQFLSRDLPLLETLHVGPPSQYGLLRQVFCSSDLRLGCPNVKNLYFDDVSTMTFGDANDLFMALTRAFPHLRRFRVSPIEGICRASLVRISDETLLRILTCWKLDVFEGVSLASDVPSPALLRRYLEAAASSEATDSVLTWFGQLFNVSSKKSRPVGALDVVHRYPACLLMGAALTMHPKISAAIVRRVAESHIVLLPLRLIDIDDFCCWFRARASNDVWRVTLGVDDKLTEELRPSVATSSARRLVALVHRDSLPAEPGFGEFLRDLLKATCSVCDPYGDEVLLPKLPDSVPAFGVMEAASRLWDRMSQSAKRSFFLLAEARQKRRSLLLQALFEPLQAEASQTSMVCTESLTERASVFWSRILCDVDGSTAKLTSRSGLVEISTEDERLLNDEVVRRLTMFRRRSFGAESVVVSGKLGPLSVYSIERLLHCLGAVKTPADLTCSVRNHVLFATMFSVQSYSDRLLLLQDAGMTETQLEQSMVIPSAGSLISLRKLHIQGCLDVSAASILRLGRLKCGIRLENVVDDAKQTPLARDVTISTLFDWMTRVDQPLSILGVLVNASSCDLFQLNEYALVHKDQRYNPPTVSGNPLLYKEPAWALLE